GLRGHHVGDDRGAADAALLEQHRLRAVPRSGQRRLVPAGAATEDHHPHTVSGAGDPAGVRGKGSAGIAHPVIVAKNLRSGGGFRHREPCGTPPRAAPLRYLLSMTSPASDPYQLAREAAAAIADASGVPHHDLALVLGSGWSGAADLLGETVWQADATTIPGLRPDRKSTRLNSSHVSVSYAVFSLKKKKMA